jgi:hypothetical protein
MPDMLVRLYNLPDYHDLRETLRAEGVVIRPALALEKDIVVEWVAHQFSALWGTECEKGFFNTPVSTLIAVDNGVLVGFASYDATKRGFFGPTGVREDQRGRQIGKLLLWACLMAMRELDYGYAVIGGVGPADFYAKAVGATMIDDSVPGVYAGILTKSQLETVEK